MSVFVVKKHCVRTTGNFKVDINTIQWATVKIVPWQRIKFCNQLNYTQDAWDCGQMFTGSVGGKWETDDCYKNQAFMCEIPAGVDVKPDQPVSRKL